MKFFLKRDGEGFLVLNQSAHTKYTVLQAAENTKQKIIVESDGKRVVAAISNKNMVIRYFSVKCGKRFYILVPCVGDCFAFAIYGSTYRFAGNMAEGRFSLFDVDKSPIMTQKKCWGKFGDGYEINIYDREQEIFALSVAVCAALYISSAQEKPVLT